MTTSYAVTHGSSDYGHSHCSPHTALCARCLTFTPAPHISHHSQKFNLFRLQLFWAVTEACSSRVTCAKRLANRKLTTSSRRTLLQTRKACSTRRDRMSSVWAKGKRPRLPWPLLSTYVSIPSSYERQSKHLCDNLSTYVSIPSPMSQYHKAPMSQYHQAVSMRVVFVRACMLA